MYTSLQYETLMYWNIAVQGMRTMNMTLYIMGCDWLKKNGYETPCMIGYER